LILLCLSGSTNCCAISCSKHKTQCGFQPLNMGMKINRFVVKRRGGGGVSMGNLVSIDWSWLTLVKTYWCSLLSKSITSPRYFNLQPKCLWQFLTPSWTRGKNSFDLCHFHKSRTTDRLQIISLYKRCFLHVVPKSELRSWEQKWASNLSRTGRKRSTAWGLVK
jgi:hypothetical protein